MQNKLNKIVSSINKLPSFARSKALSTVFGKNVKFTGTAGVCIEELTERRAVISLKNKKRVQNHIGSVHAVANILIAESATGYLIGMNIPDSSVPVIKSIHADFVKRSAGDMKAIATLSQEQINYVQSTEKGETTVPVTLSDAEQKEPVVFEMVWAWTPKKRA